MHMKDTYGFYFTINNINVYIKTPNVYKRHQWILFDYKQYNQSVRVREDNISIRLRN